MLSIKGLLGPESPIRAKRSTSREQQPPLSRSSPESQTLREWEQVGGDSPRDRQGLGILLAATGVESASFPENLQLPPPPQSLPTVTQMASSQKFRQHSIEVNTFVP